MKDKGRYSLSPDIGHFQKEGTNACKGDLKTLCDFEYDGARGHVTNSDDGNNLLRRQY